MRTLVFCVFGVKWVTPRTEVDLLVSWKGHFGKWHNIELWKFIPLRLFKKKKFIPLGLMWSIWRERECKNFWKEWAVSKEIEVFIFEIALQADVN